MYFLYLKWYALWGYAASDLRWPWYYLLPDDLEGVEDQAKDDMLDAIETIKDNVEDVLDAAMDRVGYTVYKMYNRRCLQRLSCSNGELQELNQLLRDFTKNVEEAIDY